MSEKNSVTAASSDEPASIYNAHGVLNDDLALALATGPQLNPLSIQAFKLYMIVCVAFIGSLGWGLTRRSFLSSFHGGNNLQPCSQFTEYFGISGEGGGQGIITALLFAIFNFGKAHSPALNGLILSISVRKHLQRVSWRDPWRIDGPQGGNVCSKHNPSRCTLCSLPNKVPWSDMDNQGISTVTAAQSRIYLFFGRFLLGFGSTMNTSSALVPLSNYRLACRLIHWHRPAYVVEISPPQWRGRLAGLVSIRGIHSLLYELGTTRRPRKLTSREYSWSGYCHRAHEFEPVMEDSMCHPIRSPPSSLPLASCLSRSMLSTIFQSPRWLISVGRKDEARQVLAKYHGNGDVNAPLVVLEWQELEAGIKVDGTDKRCLIANSVRSSNYITVVFDLAGVKSQERRLIFTFVSVALGALGALFGASIVDKVGRRPLWLWGTAGCAVSMALAAGNKFQPIWSPKDMLSASFSAFTAKAMTQPALAFLWMYASECLDFSNRAKGLSLSVPIKASQYFTDMLYPFQICLGSKPVLTVQSICGLSSVPEHWLEVHACPRLLGCVETIVIYLIAVETKGRTLEELDEIFEGNLSFACQLYYLKIIFPHRVEVDAYICCTHQTRSTTHSFGDLGDVGRAHVHHTIERGVPPAFPAVGSIVPRPDAYSPRQSAAPGPTAAKMGLKWVDWYLEYEGAGPQEAGVSARECCPIHIDRIFEAVQLLPSLTGARDTILRHHRCAIAIFLAQGLGEARNCPVHEVWMLVRQICEFEPHKVVVVIAQYHPAIRHAPPI
ncbi:hypothetical protein B0H14DRAFT_3775418 [Mycena olivaceomarginata]|nr:hypothetical protein B0H14DRAFT_3775418 [Mycena olivaceomarginata]